MPTPSHDWQSRDDRAVDWRATGVIAQGLLFQIVLRLSTRAHEQAKLAGAVAVHSTIGYGGDIRDDIQLLGDVKRG